MAYVSLPSAMYLPDGRGYVTTAPAIASSSFNTIGYKFGMVLQPGRDDTITKVGFRTNSINAGDVKVRIETVDLTTGFPTGTLFSAGAEVTQTLAAGDDNTYFEVTIGTPPTVNRDDLIAVLVEMVSASMGTFYHAVSGIPQWNIPYTVIYQGSWSRTTNCPNMSLCFGTAGYVPIVGVVPVTLATARTYNNGSTPDVYGNAITPAFNCKVSGAWLLADQDGDCVVKLYDTDGVTVIASSSLDLDIPPLTTVSAVSVMFDAEVTLTAGDTYYLGIEPSSATSLTTYDLDFPSANAKKNFVDTSVRGATAKDPSGVGSWTVTDTKFITCGVIISAVDDGAGGGGGFVGSGLTRGAIG